MSAAHALLPSIRQAQPADWSFLDHLQRRHHDAIGFLSRMALLEAIERKRVWLALENGEPAGYLYGRASYQRQEHVAIIYQAAICYDARRRLLGTSLVEAFISGLPSRGNGGMPPTPPVAQLCLWCAADLDANLFWSALDFEPVAMRAGARSSGRTHLFWCRHIAGTRGEFWIPERTRGGVMREGREVTRLTSFPRPCH